MFMAKNTATTKEYYCKVALETNQSVTFWPTELNISYIGLKPRIQIDLETRPDFTTKLTTRTQMDQDENSNSPQKKIAVRTMPRNNC